MAAITIKELQALLAKVEAAPRAYFGATPAKVLRELHRQAHPDRFSDDAKPEAARIFARFTQLAAAAEKPVTVVTTPTAAYTLEKLLGIGDICDVHLATTATGAQCVVKVPRFSKVEKLLIHENFVLKELRDTAEATTYGRYLPKPIETAKTSGTPPLQVNVFEHTPGGFTLEQVRAKYPDGLDGRHIAWVFKRLLTVVGFAHRQQWTHNAVLPPHVLLYPESHGLQLVDWKTAGKGAPLRLISTPYRNWYPPEVLNKQSTGPATDIYMAGKCAIYLAGGDPSTQQIPASVPTPMAALLRAATLSPMSMRPTDAWELMDDFSKMLLGLYGPPKFVPLSMV